MTNQFSRRTVIAAIDVLEGEWFHAHLTAFLTELGPEVYTKIRVEPTSLKNRMSDLKQFIDRHPGTLVAGEPLETMVVEKAVSKLHSEPRNSWSSKPQPKPAMETFKRMLESDGFTVMDATLRRILPADIGLPAAESELMRLLDQYGLEMPKGHLQQAMDAHTRGNWAGANAQIRAFLDGLLDTLAERIDPSAHHLPTGQARRTKLAAAGFLSVPLNEWTDDGRGYINGLVKRLHPVGAHPGLSNEEDSTFRLHTVLLTTTLLLRRYDRRIR